MSDHVFELLGEFALKTLSEDDSARVAAHIEVCAACADELRATNTALAMVAAPLPQLTPSSTARSRLVQAIGFGGRFEDFADRIAKLFDLPLEKAQTYLHRVDQPERWVAGPAHGVSMLPIRPGPRCAKSMSGFVKVCTGSVFPEHTHNGDEATVVLQGACRDPDGTVYRRHMDIAYSEGSSHSFTAIEDIDFIAAVCLHGGFQLHDTTS